MRSCVLALVFVDDFEQRVWLLHMKLDGHGLLPVGS